MTGSAPTREETSPPSGRIPPTEPQAVTEAKTALGQGDFFHAYDLATAALERFPNSVGLRYAAALALARSGATESALDLYERLDLRSQADEDTLALGARLLKDLAFEARLDRQIRLREAGEAYHRIFQSTGGYFSGINAATLFVLAGDASRGEDTARTLLADPKLQRDGSYYAVATIGEAELLLGRTTDAAQTLARARALAGRDYSSIATTRRQLARILAYRKEDTSDKGILAALSVPRVAFYCGHMVAGPHALDEGWQKTLAAGIDSAIERSAIGVAFGGLACGADILFAEALLNKGVELNVVLPFKQEDYLRYSVEPGGAPWIARFHECLGRATSLTYASFNEYVGDPAQFSYGSAVAMGMAHLRARHLQTSAVQLAAFDGVVTGGQAGTAADIDAWKAFGGTSEIIPFARPLSGQVARPAIEVRNEAGGVPARKVCSIIFSDVHGFSKIAESRIPIFWNGIMKRCAAAIEVHDKNVVYRNTWGDSLYLIIDDISIAADLALSLHDCVTADDAQALGLSAAPKLRVALHHGPLFEGYDPVCQEMTFFGSEVSRTARIEPATPLGAVFVTEPFAAILAMHAGSRFSCNYAGRLELAKGYGAFRMYRLTRGRQP
jgi:class 3 adenylate cyclase/tetratricopeptide (TPR) repeat protein